MYNSHAVRLSRPVYCHGGMESDLWNQIVGVVMGNVLVVMGNVHVENQNVHATRIVIEISVILSAILVIEIAIVVIEIVVIGTGDHLFYHLYRDCVDRHRGCYHLLGSHGRIHSPQCVT